MISQGQALLNVTLCHDTLIKMMMVMMMIATLTVLIVHIVIFNCLYLY